MVIIATFITSFLAPRTLWVLKTCFFGYLRPPTNTWSQKEQHLGTFKFSWLRTQCHTFCTLILLSLCYHVKKVPDYHGKKSQFTNHHGNKSLVSSYHDKSFVAMATSPGNDELCCEQKKKKNLTSPTQSDVITQLIKM